MQSLGSSPSGARACLDRNSEGLRARAAYTSDWGGSHFDNWFVADIPTGALCVGRNEILLWSDSVEPSWEIMVAADGEYARGSRTRFAHPDRSAKSRDGGKTWEAPKPIMDMGTYGGLPEDQNGCSDPNILVDKETGDIWVCAVWTHGKPGTHQWRGRGSEPGLELHQSTQFMMVRSSDDGQSWSKPENWTSRLKNPKWHLFAPAPGNGITMKNGTLVIPTDGRDEEGLPFSNLLWSQDHGETWSLSSPARSDTTECAVAELSDGTLMLNMRDNRNRGDKTASNGRAVSITANLGETWRVHSSDHRSLPEPVCMASLISHTLSDGRHILFFSNPNHRSKRKNMTVRMSLDDGKTWTKSVLLDEAGGAYSSLVMVNSSTLGILYESSRADMVFQKIALHEFGLSF